jgi:hypothetical protein
MMRRWGRRTERIEEFDRVLGLFDAIEAGVELARGGAELGDSASSGSS